MQKFSVKKLERSLYRMVWCVFQYHKPFKYESWV